VIDYTREDFTQTGQRCNVMLDLVGNSSLSDCRRVLAPRGTYVLVGVADMGRWFGLTRQIKVLGQSRLCARGCAFIVRHNKGDLVVLKEFVEAGKVTPVIDRRYELTGVLETLRYQGEGHVQGKIVIAV
jgi:NADPH:quinone reductase-like Zn-dependent oxidoreductase